jgi:hypothetical protein
MEIAHGFVFFPGEAAKVFLGFGISIFGFLSTYALRT